MASLRAAAALLGLATVILCSCGPSGGGVTASSQPAASSAPPAAAPAPPAASDVATSGAAASALPPVAAAPPAPVATPKKQPTAAELLRDDPAYAAKERTLDALYENAKVRDPTGQVEREQSSALAQRRACADKACLDTWFRRREAALKQYIEN
ncbi:MAG: hypothetical protein ACXU82_02890 [Caulobacteraceae bacterium]